MMAVGARSNSPVERLMQGVRRCVRYPSSDAALVRGSTSPRQERLPRLSKDDGDNLTILTHVQRQLVQKSFQTHAFEAKIRAKDRDDEHATTASEVLQQALRIHAASVASLHVDGLPSADDYRFRMPKRSLGRFQYEDLSRMPQALTAEPPTQAADRAQAFGAAAATSDAPSPRQRSQSQLQLRQPSWRHRPPDRALRAGGVSSGSPSSTGTGDGNVSGSTGDGASGADPDGSARGELSPPRGGGSWRQHRAMAAAPILRAASGGVGGAPRSQQHAFGGNPGPDAERGGAESVAGCAPLLHRTDSALRRADQMLQALREFHGSSGVAAAGVAGGAGPALPFLQAKHRHAAGGAGAGAGRGHVVLGGRGGSRGGYAPRQVVVGQAALADQDNLAGTTPSAAGPSFVKSPGRRRPPPPPQQQQLHPYFPQRHLRSRSPYAPQLLTRSMDSIPCAAAAAPPPLPAPAAAADPARVPVTQDGYEFAPPVRTSSGLSFNAALWNRSSPPRPRPPSREMAGADVAAEGPAQRPTAASGDGHPGGAPPPPPRHGRSRRASSVTNDGEDLGGGGGAAAASLLSMPVAPATEQLFTRICRSSARACPQQNWVPVFEAPLPVAAASSVFTAASCGASPYAARGLSAGTDGGVAPGGGGAAAGCCTRPPLAPPAQRPPSGPPPQSRAASPGAVKLPPIPDTADGASGLAAPADAPPEQRAARRGRTRPSLSWSVAEGAATAAFVQRARQMAPPQDATATVAVAPPPQQQQSAQGEHTAAAAPPRRPHATAAAAAAATAGTADEQQQQQQQPDDFRRRANRERSVSTDGGMLRKEGGASAVAAAAARIELTGAARAADRGGMAGFLHRGEAGGRGGGFVTPRAKPRRAAVLGGGAGFGVVSYGRGGGGGGGGPGGSPSIMTRMRKALGSIWPRSPGAP